MDRLQQESPEPIQLTEIGRISSPSGFPEREWRRPECGWNSRRAMFDQLSSYRNFWQASGEIEDGAIPFQLVVNEKGNRPVIQINDAAIQRSQISRSIARF